MIAKEITKEITQEILTGIISSSFNLPSGPKSHITIKTDNVGISASNEFDLPLVATGTYNCDIYSKTGFIKNISVYTDNKITFPSTGTYELFIFGTLDGFDFSNGGDKDKLIRVKSTDTVVFGAGASPFWGCSNLVELNVAASSFAGMSNIVSFARSCPLLSTIPNVQNWPWSSFSGIDFAFRDSLLYDGVGLENAAVGSNLFSAEGAFWNTSVDRNLGAWNPFNMQFALDFINSLSTTNYDLLLSSWGAKANNGDFTFNDGEIDFGLTKYSASLQSSRDDLENNGYGAEFNDGGPV